MKPLKLLIWAVSLTAAQFSFAQFENLQLGSVTGNIESTYQFYRPDSNINAQVPPEKGAMNSFANVNYRNSFFKAGWNSPSFLKTSYDHNYTLCVSYHLTDLIFLGNSLQ